MSSYLGLDELVAVVGEAAALRLLSARGGGRVYVPGRLGDGHWLIQTMGEAAALALVGHVTTGSGGAMIDLPRGPTGYQAEQRARLDRAIAEGKSANEAARQLGINRRTYFRAKKRKPGDSRQMKLL